MNKFDNLKIKFISAFVVLFVILFTAGSAIADVMPYYTSALSKETIGFLKMPKSFKLYLYPRTDSQVVETVDWNKFEVKFRKTCVEPADVFAVQVPSKNTNFFMVVDEQEDWYKIIYDKKQNKSAWVKPDSNEDFWGLRDFYSIYAKQYGLYYMKNIDYRKRGIYSGAYDDSQKLNGFTLIKSIKLHKISGNWALVTVVDFDSKPKIGYIRWREDDGSILLFPKFDK